MRVALEGARLGVGCIVGDKEGACVGLRSRTSAGSGSDQCDQSARRWRRSAPCVGAAIVPGEYPDEYLGSTVRVPREYPVQYAWCGRGVRVHGRSSPRKPVHGMPSVRLRPQYA